MSLAQPVRYRTSLIFLIVSIGFFVFGVSSAAAHNIEVKITVLSPARVVVEGKFLEERFSEEKNWTFLQSYADVSDLGRRIVKFELFNDKGEEIVYKKFAPGIYTAKSGAVKWRYEIDLRPLEAPTAAAHVSWLLPDGGLLMPEDLLPRL